MFDFDASPEAFKSRLASKLTFSKLMPLHEPMVVSGFFVFNYENSGYESFEPKFETLEQTTRFTLPNYEAAIHRFLKPSPIFYVDTPKNRMLCNCLRVLCLDQMVEFAQIEIL